MTQQNPTAADFFGQPHEDDEPEFSVGPGSIWQLPTSPLESIAVSLSRLADHFDGAQTFTAELSSTEGVMVPGSAYSDQIDRAQVALEEAQDANDKLREVNEVLDRIEAALGKSTAKPALAAKAVIEAYRNPVIEVPAEGEGADVVDPGPLPEPIQPQGDLGYVGGQLTTDTGPVTINEPEAPVSQAPANDAPVEEWREYARAQGFAGPDIDKANRSQIRTALGIAQPVSS